MVGIENNENSIYLQFWLTKKVWLTTKRTNIFALKCVELCLNYHVLKWHENHSQQMFNHRNSKFNNSTKRGESHEWIEEKKRRNTNEMCVCACVCVSWNDVKSIKVRRLFLLFFLLIEVMTITLFLCSVSARARTRMSNYASNGSNSSLLVFL